MPIDIHPLDMAAMLNDTSKNEITDIYIRADGSMEINGTIYRQTVAAPILTEYGLKLVAGK